MLPPVILGLSIAELEKTPQWRKYAKWAIANLDKWAPMPSKSGKQHRAMEAAAHGRGNIGIPTKVAKDFVQADVGKHFKSKGKRK